MKVLAINGSPHKKGNTAQALGIVTEKLEKSHISTELITIGNQSIQGCIGCMSCRKTGRCVLADHFFSHLSKKILQADGLLLGSPVYYGGINGTLKSFLDRFFFTYAPQMHLKIGASLVVLRRSGAMGAYEQLVNYMTAAGMLLAPGYWDVVFGSKAGDVLQDGEGVWKLQSLGQNMAWLLRVIAATKDSLPAPTAMDKVTTSFIRR